jgi:hypothetical protein
VSLVGPRHPVQRYGFKAGDFHLVVNDEAEVCRAFNSDGKELWSAPALARGQGSDTVWNQRFSDTPPGTYRIGQVYRDYENPRALMRDKLAYGWYSFDLIDLESQEAGNGRAGIMIHGGGSALGWDAAWAPYQPLLPTLGCIRMQNAVLRDRILPMTESGGTVFCSVWQEAA